MINYDVNYENILNTNGNYVLIVLNESLNDSKSNSKTFKNIWKNAKKRVLVDGANNWLYRNQKEFGNPDFICGDMDSISDEAMKYFEKQITSKNIIRLPDQDYTDFDKSVNFSLNEFKELNIDYFLVTWAQSDRIDHTLQCISTLIKYFNMNVLPIYLLDINNSLSIILNNSKKIKINKNSKWCSLVPVGEPSTITTTGFRWNMIDFEMKFGKLISTSNEFDLNEDYCTINCNKPILFSMHLPLE